MSRAPCISKSRAPTACSSCLFNANKRSLTLNLKTDDGKRLFKEVVKQSDVLLENFGPGAMDRLGLGWDVLRDLNPRLIYATIKGFGSYGPYAHFKSYEPVAQAMGGAMSGHRLPGKPADPRAAGDRRQRHRHAHGDRHPRGIAAAPSDRPRPACRGVDAGCGGQSDPGQPARPPAQRRPMLPRSGNQLGHTVPGTTYPCAPGGPNDYVIILGQPQMWPALVRGARAPGTGRGPALQDAPMRAGRTATRSNAIVEEWTRAAHQARGHDADGRCRRAVRRLPGHRRGAGRPASEGARDDRRYRLPDARHLQDRRLPGQIVGIRRPPSPARHCSASTPPNCCTRCAASIRTRSSACASRVSFRIPTGDTARAWRGLCANRSGRMDDARVGRLMVAG